MGVALWLRHDPQTSNLLQIEFDGAQAPNTFYIGMFLVVKSCYFHFHACKSLKSLLLLPFHMIIILLSIYLHL